MPYKILFQTAIRFIEDIPKTCRYIVFVLSLLFIVLYKVKDEEVNKSEVQLKQFQKWYYEKDSAYIETLKSASKAIESIKSNSNN